MDEQIDWGDVFDAIDSIENFSVTVHEDALSTVTAKLRSQEFDYSVTHIGGTPYRKVEASTPGHQVQEKVAEEHDNGEVQ